MTKTISLSALRDDERTVATFYCGREWEPEA